MEEVEVVAATVDLDEVVSWRGKNSSQREQASAAPRCGTAQTPPPHWPQWSL